MSDEKTSQMNVNIGKRVRNYAIVFVILILFLIWGNDIASLLAKSLSTQKDESEAAQKIIASIITAIGGLVAIVLNLGRDIDLHNFIDRKVFGVRHKTGDIIHNKMIEAAQRVGAPSWRNMQGKRKEVSYLFYHFVNDQEVLRDLAFTYWEQYFVNIYVFCFAFTGFVISSTLVLLRWRFDLAIAAPISFLLILVAIGLSTRSSLVRKIYDLPVQQIEEIRTGHADALKDEVEKRFGDVIAP